MRISQSIRSAGFDPLAVVNRHGWLAACPEPFRRFIGSKLRWRAGEAGQSVCHAGDEGAQLYCCARGQIAYLSALGAPSVGSAYFGYPGSWWGVAPLFGLPYQVSAIGRTPYLVGSFSVAEARAYLAANPAAWEQFGLLLTDLQIVSAGGHLDQLNPSSLTRVAGAILRFSGRRHRRYPVDCPISFVCSQAEIATAAAVSRNTAGNHLRTLEARGLIDAGYTSICIRDVEGLETLANAD